MSVFVLTVLTMSRPVKTGLARKLHRSRKTGPRVARLTALAQSPCGYPHHARTHRALAQDSPVPRPVLLPSHGTVVELPQVRGLHHLSSRRAAWPPLRATHATPASDPARLFRGCTLAFAVAACGLEPTQRVASERRILHWPSVPACRQCQALIRGGEPHRRSPNATRNPAENRGRTPGWSFCHPQLAARRGSNRELLKRIKPWKQPRGRGQTVDEADRCQRWPRSASGAAGMRGCLRS
jgi:hypothetical protein